ncbi:MAG: hypothetical protein E6J62_16935 [Deltaproteobacteria bacterium]|nr:MAG: hypothetical protein E6J62_16935 [Deltaproteobacteria bacterium]
MTNFSPMRRFLTIALLLAGSACGFGSDGASGSGTPEPTPPGEPQVWLDTQNAVRHRAQPPPVPALADFTWSSAAAAVAQDWANRCTYQHNAGRGNRGENIAASAPPGSTIADTVNAWAGEASFYDHAKNSCDAGQDCGHYTQIVWRDSVRAGCARQTCTINSPFGAQNPNWDFWVCDYEPPGNVIGQRPY